MKTKRQRKPKTVTTPEFCRPTSFPSLSRTSSTLVISSAARNANPTAILRRFLLPLALLTLCLAQISPARSARSSSPLGDKKEKPYALIFGTVWGPDDLPIYGIPVRIRRASEKKARWELYSDHRGEFALRVPAGKTDYVIWADVKHIKLSDGRHLQPGEPAQIHVEYDERVDTGLHLK